MHSNRKNFVTKNKQVRSISITIIMGAFIFILFHNKPKYGSGADHSKLLLMYVIV